MFAILEGGQRAAPDSIDPLFIRQAAGIVVKGMMDWGILPSPADDTQVKGWANTIAEARLGRNDCNGFRLAVDLDKQWGWGKYELDARAVDMLSRLDAIAQEIQVNHQRQVEGISAAWADTFGVPPRPAVADGPVTALAENVAAMAAEFGRRFPS